MTTRMTLLSNPRLALFALVLPILLAIGIAVFPLMGAFYGILTTLIAAFVDWTLLKLLRRQMRTTVTVDEEGARFVLYGEEKIGFAWTEMALIGMAVEKGKRGPRARKLFFYKEDGDRLMVVPAEFERFSDLVSEVRRFAPSFRDITLDAGENLKDRLRPLLVPAADRAVLN